MSNIIVLLILIFYFDCYLIIRERNRLSKVIRDRNTRFYLLTIFQNSQYIHSASHPGEAKCTTVLSLNPPGYKYIIYKVIYNIQWNIKTMAWLMSWWKLVKKTQSVLSNFTNSVQEVGNGVMTLWCKCWHLWKHWKQKFSGNECPMQLIVHHNDVTFICYIHQTTHSQTLTH